MEQYRNLDSVMEAENHFKNGASLKSQMSKGNKFKKAILFIAIVCFSVGAWGQTVSAKIENIWVDYDVSKDGEKGMNIHIKFSFTNMLNTTGWCVAFFCDENGNALKDYNQRYNDAGGNISSGTQFTPNIENGIYNDWILFMPYDELHLNNGTHSLKFSIAIFDNNSKQVTISEFQNFTYSKNAPEQNNYSSNNNSNLGSSRVYSYENNWGDNSEMMTISCPKCVGTGNELCMRCYGSGTITSIKYVYDYYVGSRPMTNYDKCMSCYGSGRIKCTGCNGTGVITTSVESVVLMNSYYNNGGSSGSSSSSSSSSGSKNSSRGSCTLCGGTGQMIKNDGPNYTGSSKWCELCGRTVDQGHYHTKCTSCGGTGSK